jgi:hypothetical protein
MRPAHRLLAGVLAAGAFLTAGCAQSVDPIERLGRKAAQGMSPHAPASSPHAPAAPPREPLPPAHAPVLRAPASASVMPSVAPRGRAGSVRLAASGPPARTVRLPRGGQPREDCDRQEHDRRERGLAASRPERSP